MGPNSGMRYAIAMTKFRPQYQPRSAYLRMSVRASTAVISTYSTSFSLATRFLRPQRRNDIRSLYAVVRIADEIVDGTASANGLTTQEIIAELNAFEQEILAAPQRTFSPNPVVQAYGEMARRRGIKAEHVRAFFSSMRMDCEGITHTPETLRDYIYGSAEVIGMMCCHIFVDAAQAAELEPGARALGAAFQNINFLRDIGFDARLLGRTYLDAELGRESDHAPNELLIAAIREDLATARAHTAGLPRDARLAVAIATQLYTALLDKLAATPPRQLATTRVRVSNLRKVGIVLGEMILGEFGLLRRVR